MQINNALSALKANMIWQECSGQSCAVGHYAGSYLADPDEKVLLGINFSGQEKTVDDWQYILAGDADKFGLNRV